VEELIGAERVSFLTYEEHVEAINEQINRSK
jgi:hypothetical protein